MKKNCFLFTAFASFLAVAVSSCDKNDVLPPIEHLQQDSSITLLLNLADFGADSSGNADSYPAFEKLFAAMGQSPLVDVYIPAGRYRISKRVVFDQNVFKGYNTNHGLRIRGAGVDVTELLCDNDQGGIYFNAGTNRITVSISDMSLVSPVDHSGTAVEFNTENQNPGDQHSRMLQLTNVLIRGEKFDKGYFTNGVLCYNAWYPMLENVKLTNRYGNDAGNYKMNTGFLFQDCYSPLVSNCYFWGNADYGLLYKAVNTQPEDGIVSNSYFVGQENGIYIDLKAVPDWAEPAFHVTNCHINYLRNGLYLKGIRQVFVSNNLFYCHNEAGSRWKNDPNPVSDYESRDINCDYTSDLIISNNQFTEPASPKRIAVDISANSSNILLDGNIFNFDGTGIRNNSAKPSRAIGNVFGGEPLFTVGFVPYLDITGTLQRIDF